MRTIEPVQKSETIAIGLGSDKAMSLRGEEVGDGRTLVGLNDRGVMLR